MCVIVVFSPKDSYSYSDLASTFLRKAKQGALEQGWGGGWGAGAAGDGGGR